MTHLALGVLGPLQVMRNEQPVSGLAYAKVRALLVYLAVEARPHSRDVLAAFLWPDQPSATARSSLRVALTILRRALGDLTAPVPVLLATRDSVQINPASTISLDVNTFADLLRSSAAHRHPAGALCPDCALRLTEAVELYRGEFLQNLEIRGSAAFEEWVTLRREQLHRDALAALDALATNHESRGDDDLARHYAWRTLALEPWDEAAHRCLMRVLARKGQRRAALEQYLRLRKVLVKELGSEPATETTALYEHIRTGTLARTVGSMPQASPAVTNLPIASASVPTALIARDYTDLPLAQRHNLPAQLTTFVGRAADLARLAELLADPACRLLTIMGAGGSGKTWLALQVAQEYLEAHQCSVYFVQLASISSADLLIPAIADSLSFAFNGPQEPRVQLLNYLREKQVLLILDNFEHVLDGVEILADIVTNAAKVQLLVTSRERLKLHGEWVYEIRGLAVPETPTAAHLEEYSSVQLFLQGARRAQTTFSLEAADKLAIARLCHMVEGLPLGLELAASWVRLLSCKEIVQELAQSLGFLTTSTPNLPERHRSLRAVFDHSWNLLSLEERNIFQRLSIFQGGFRREAAERVAGASLSLLAALVDKSLLYSDRLGRYQMHELLRQYGSERLAAASAEKETIHDYHSHFYLEFLSEQEPRLKSNQQQQAIADIKLEIGNVRLAWQWAVAQEWAKEMGQVTQTLWLFYDAQGWYQEAAALFGQAAEMLGSDRATQPVGMLAPRDFAQEPRSRGADEQERGIGLGQVLAQQGWFLLHLGLIGKARELFQQSVAILRRFHARVVLGDTLQMFSMVTWAGGDYQAAQAILQEGLAIFREQDSLWGIAVCLLCLGNVTALMGDYREAKQLLQQALALSKETGDPKVIGLVLSYLSPVANTLGEHSAAKQWLQENLTISRAIGDRWNMIVCFNQLGALAAQGDAEEWPEAKRLHEASLALSKELGNRREMAVSLNYLGYVTCALAEYPEAKQYFLTALQTAMEAQLAPVALDALVGQAILLSHEPTSEIVHDRAKKNQRAVELLALVLRHSASSQEVKEKAQRLLAEVAEELSPQQLAAAQERGQARKLDEVVAEILAEKTTLDAPI